MPVLEALRNYLGAKLDTAPGALTFNDVHRPLQKRGAQEQTLARLKRLFADIEARQFAGNAVGDEDISSLIKRTRAIAEELEPLRQAFFKSVVAGIDLPEGTILERDHLTIKKPGTGIPANQLENVIGRRLGREVLKDELIQEEDLE